MTSVPEAIVRVPPRGLARIVELGVLVAGLVAAISTTMPLISAEEWRMCGYDRETYDLVYGGVARVSDLGGFVPPLLVAGRAVSVLRGYRGGSWVWLIDAFAILVALFAISFADTSKQDAGRDFVIIGHAVLLGMLAVVRPAASIVRWRWLRR